MASTKTFLAQLTANYLVGLALAQARGTKYADEVAREYHDLGGPWPIRCARVLTCMEPVTALAQRFAQASSRAVPGPPCRLPGGPGGCAQTQGTGLHARRGFAAGELKHGPIALIEDDLPVIVVMPSPKSAATLHAKLLSNIREIQARGAVTIVIAEEGDDMVGSYADHLIEIPAVSTLFQPLLLDDPHAGVRRRGGAGAWLRRGQAAQPGQVGHRRVAAQPARLAHSLGGTPK